LLAASFAFTTGQTPPMPAETEAPLPVEPCESDRSARAARRGAQVALMVFLALSCAFALSSTWQLARAVFFEGDPPAASTLPSIPPRGPAGGE
jgi:hypothetical protein